MRPFFVAATVALLSGAAVHAAKPHGKTAVPKAEARQAALTWLHLTDSGQYDKSWETASSLFKAQITQAQWAQAASGVRDPLGPVKSRVFKSVHYTRTLPGAPDGEYAVIQYRTSFEKKAAATETVTPMKDKDGHWRVSGYYIR